MAHIKFVPVKKGGAEGGELTIRRVAQPYPLSPAYLYFAKDLKWFSTATAKLRDMTDYINCYGS